MLAKTIAFLVKDLITISMDDLSDRLKKNLSHEILKSNNKYISIAYDYTDDKREVEHELISYIKHRITKDACSHMKEIYKDKGIKTIGDFINDETIDIFFDISEDDGKLIIEKN